MRGIRRGTLACCLFMLAACSETDPCAEPGSCAKSNQWPVADSSTGEMEEDSPLTSWVSAADPDGSPVEFVVYRWPAAGSLQLDRATGEFTYLPDKDFNGHDGFWFRAWDGKAFSEPAPVELTVLPVNDPPVAVDVGPQHNSAYSLDSWISLPISDVDENLGEVVAVSDDPDVAVVSVEDSWLKITPTGRGSTNIRVRGGDGEYDAETQFGFDVGDVTREAEISRPDEPSVVELRNDSDRLVPFTLNYNGHQSFGSAAEAARYVADAMAPEYPGEPFPRKLWRYVRDNTYHYVPVNTQYMWYDMWASLNSLGWGFCSHVSAVYVEIAKAAGYPARVWGLEGHVVPEIYWNGRWEMYDPDLSVHYFDRTGKVAGVEQLAQDPTLITAPINPVLPTLAAYTGAYSAFVASLYASSSDNYVDTTKIFSTRQPSGSTQLSLPAGSRLLLAGRWTGNPVGYDGSGYYVVPEYRQAALELPADWVGNLAMPWILWDIQGSGVVRIGTREFSTSDPALRTLVQNPKNPITSLEIVSSPDGLRLVFLVNATWYDVLQENNISVTGQDVWAVEIGTATVPQEVSTGIFPDSYRKPAELVVPD